LGERVATTPPKVLRAGPSITPEERAKIGKKPMPVPISTSSARHDNSCMKTVSSLHRDGTAFKSGIRHRNVFDQDLVRTEQIRVASGLPLSFTQSLKFLGTPSKFN
jgi:hypothetical protein